MKFHLPEIKGLEQFKKVEKEKVEKPFERPVEPLDHDDKRRKFQEALHHDLEAFQKIQKKGQVEAVDLHPSLFQLARLTPPLDDKIGDALDEDEAKQEKRSNSEDELVVSGSPYTASQACHTAYVRHERVSAVSSKEETPLRVNQAEIIEVIEQMVKALVIVEKSDVRETKVTLQHPPLFEGSSFTVREHVSSQKEFSITFENIVNPEARALIEQPHAEALLRASLLDRGYTLQMVTIEPKLEFHVTGAEETGLQDTWEREKKQDAQDKATG